MRLISTLFFLFSPALFASECEEKIKALLIENGNITKLALDFRADYKHGKKSDKRFEKQKAISIAKSEVTHHIENGWDAVFVDGYWVVRYSKCSGSWRGGAGLLLVDQSTEEVVLYQLEK
jgi:hypothetical protein